MSQIFSLWTILTSREEDGVVEYTYKPHPVQILSSIILLGLIDIKDYMGFKSRFA